MTTQTILPDGWPRPKGYANGMVAQGRILAIAGLIGWDETETIHSDDFLAQFRQALANVVAVIEAADGRPEHLVSLTIYVTDKHEYVAALEDVGAAWREAFGKHYCAMALVQVADLLHPRAKVELQGIAVLPTEG